MQYVSTNICSGEIMNIKKSLYVCYKAEKKELPDLNSVEKKFEAGVVLAYGDTKTELAHFMGVSEAILYELFSEHKGEDYIPYKNFLLSEVDIA